MQVWRLQVYTSQMNIANYCIEHNVAAMGWCFYDDSRSDLQNERKLITSFDDYSEWYKKWSEKEVANSVNRLAKDIQIGDLIWLYNKNDGFYYIGKCISDYKFNNSDEAVNHDACNQVGVEWHRYADISNGNVPGAIITSLIRGSTFQRIHKTGAESFSKYAYNIASGTAYYDNITFNTDKDNFFSMLSNDDCEDLLYLYLFNKYGYVCIPSSNKKGTKDIEFDMVDPKTGTHYYAQVKQQDDNLDARDYKEFVKKNQAKIYFLSTKSAVDNIDDLGEFGEVIDPLDIYDFALSDAAQKLLSKSMKFWLELLHSYNANKTNTGIKGVMFDTDSPEHEKNMISKSKISAYGRSKRYIDSSFNIGDYVLYYKNGAGVIAVGKIISDRKEIPSDEEYYRDVEFVFPKQNEIDVNKYIPASEIKRIANHNFFFASTIKSPFVNTNLVDVVINELKKKY